MDQRQLKALLDRLDTTPCIVTSSYESKRDGCIVTFITRCSLDPPRVLVCTSHETMTNSLVERSHVLALHPLARGQEPLISLFGGETGREVDKFQGLAWRTGLTGAPILSDAIGYLEGRVLSTMDCGDHTARLVDPLAVEIPDPNAPPLTIFELFARGIVPPTVALGDPWSVISRGVVNGSDRPD
jgi:flavin reductase (DIM6/NTAB) family NADH-FMN oxidoreductase RutF